jgi:hypothetical protein
VAQDAGEGAVAVGGETGTLDGRNPTNQAFALWHGALAADKATSKRQTHDSLISKESAVVWPVGTLRLTDPRRKTTLGALSLPHKRKKEEKLKRYTLPYKRRVLSPALRPKGEAHSAHKGHVVGAISVGGFENGTM